MDMKLDNSLQKQDKMLNVQNQILQIGRETKDEVTGLRKDTRSYLDEEFKELRKELTTIKDALIRAGIPV